jgi:hypothetical protein
MKWICATKIRIRVTVALPLMLTHKFRKPGQPIIAGLLSRTLYVLRALSIKTHTMIPMNSIARKVRAQPFYLPDAIPYRTEYCPLMICGGLQINRDTLSGGKEITLSQYMSQIIQSTFPVRRHFQA